MRPDKNNKAAVPNSARVGEARKALLTSASLPALLAGGAGFAGSISAALAAGENGSGGDLWAPAVGASATVSENDTLGALELFMPIAQDEDSVFFLDLRVNPQDLSDMSGSFGAGLQQVISPDVMVGGYAYFNSEQVGGKSFQGVTLGAQVVTSTLDVSANVYLPTSDDVVLTSTGAATGASSTPTLSLIGNQLFAVTAAGQRLQVRRQMRGADVEAGYRLRNIFGEGKSLRFSAGGYHYESPENRNFDISGGRLGLEFEYRPSSDIYSPRFSVSGTVSHDNQNDTQWAGAVRFIMPLGGDDGTRTYGQALDPAGERADLGPVASQALRERLGASSLRPTGVISGVDDSGPSTPEVRTVPIDPATGQPIGQFAFADDANTSGQGTFQDPTTLAGAVGTAGQSGYVVALENGLAGDINSDGVTLQNGQTLLGGGSTITVLVNGTATQFTVPGQAGIIRGTNAATPAITLAENNTIKNITVTGAGTGIFASGVNGAMLEDVRVQNTGGPGVHVLSGTGTFEFKNVDIMDTAGAGLSVDGGTANIQFDADSSISQSINAAALAVLNGHSGTVTSDGTVTATNGTGLQFNDADGTYNINGTTALNGGDAGIDITNGSGGTFNFGDKTTITNPTGGGLSVDGGAAAVNFNGSITNNQAAVAAVRIANAHNGSVNFGASSTIADTMGQGILLDDADGTYTFGGTSALSGTNGISITNGSDGTFTFGANTAINDPTMGGLNVDGGTAQVSFSGAITNSQAATAAVRIANAHSGTVELATSSSITDTGGLGIVLDDADGTYTFGGTAALSGTNGVAITNGSGGTFTFGANTAITDPSAAALRVANSMANVTFDGTITQNNAAAAVEIADNTGGTVDVNGAVTANTATANAVSLTNNMGATVSFNGGLDIDTTTGTGFTATGGGTVAIADAGDESINTTAGQALNLNGIEIAATGMNFDALSSTGVTDDAIDIANVSGGGFIAGTTTVTNSAQDGISIDGSSANFTFGATTVTDAGDEGVALNGTNGNVTFATLDVDGANRGISASNNTGTLTINGGTIDNTAQSGVELTNTNSAISNLTLGGAATGLADDISTTGIAVINDGAANTLNTFNTITMGGGGAGDTGDVAGKAVTLTATGTGVADVRFTGTNTLRSTDEALEATAVNENTLRLSLDGITAERGTAGFTIDVQGSGHTATTSDIVVTSLNDLTVTGNGTSGGVLFEETAFDADGVSGGAVTQVTGSATIGSTAQRVQGDGLSFLQTGGDLNLSTLNIANNGGTGLEVDTKSVAPATTFNLVTGGGSVDTTGGATLFLDPLSGTLNFTSVTSAGTTTGGATNTGTSGNGSAITVDGLTGSLTIGTTSITGLAAGETGIKFTNNGAGDTFDFGTVTIVSSADNVRGIDLTGTDGETITTGGGSSINLTGAGSVGLDLSDAGVNTNFTFGDGTAPPSSTINAETLLDTTGYNNTGTINLLDVDFSNQSFGPAFQQNDLHFFAQTARGVGDGSSIANASNTTTADAVTTADTTFVAVGGGVIDLNVNGDGSFDLAANQDLVTFDVTGGSVQTDFTNPFSNIQFNSTAGSIEDTANEGRTGLSTSAGGASDSVVVLGENSQLTNLLIDNSDGGAETGLFGTGAIGTAALTNVDVTGTAVGLSLLNLSGTLTADATSSINNTTSRAVVVNGGTATITYNGAVSETDGVGGGITVDNLTANGITFGGAVTISSGTSNAVRVNSNTGATVAFTGGLDIDTTTGQGFHARNGGTLNILASLGDESITTTNGKSLTFEAITTNVTFDSITADGGGMETRGLEIDNLGANSSFTVTGATQVTNFRNQGLRIEDFVQTGINISFGDVTVSGVDGDSILLQGMSDATLTFGTTNVTLGNGSGARGIQFEDGSSGNISFGATTISNVGGGNNQTGIDFDDAVSGAVTFADLDISGPATSTSSIGIDLTNLTGNGTIQAGDTAVGGQSASIAGLHRGVVIGSATQTQFTFGDGEGVQDTGSSIDVNGLAGSFTVDAGGGTLAASNFDFDDVTIGAGDQANMPAAPTAAVFVSEAGGTIGAGTNGLSTSLNTITVFAAEALADTDQTFVFVAGTNGGTIDLVGGGGDGFTLDAGQKIDGFAGGNSISFGSLQPTNITGNLGVLGGTVTGNVVTASNSVGGATSVINASGANGNRIENFNIDATGLAFADRGILVANSTGSVVVENVELSNVGTSATGVLLLDNAGTVTLNNVDLTGNNTGTALSIDEGGTSTGTVTVAATSDLDGTTGTVVKVGTGTRDVSYNAAINVSGNTTEVVSLQNQSGGTISFSGGITSDAATGSAAINVSGQANGTTNFGNVSITNFGNSISDAAVAVSGSAAGTVTFGDLDVATANGRGVVFSGPSVSTTSGTISTNGGSGLQVLSGSISGSLDSVATTGNSALIISSAAIGNSGFTIGQVTATNSGTNDGVDLSSVDTGATGLSIGSAQLSGSTAVSLDFNNISGAGGVTIAAADIDMSVISTSSTAKGIEIDGLVSGNGITIGNGSVNGITGLSIDEVGGVTSALTSAIFLNNTSGTVNIANAATGQLVIGNTDGPHAGIRISGNFGGTANIGNSTNQAMVNAGIGVEISNINATADINLANLVVSSSDSNGVSISAGASGATIDIVGLTVNQTGANATSHGVNVSASDATITISGLDVNSAGGLGILAQDNNQTGSFTLSGASNTIDSVGQHGIAVFGGVYSFSNLTIGGTTAATLDGVRLLVNGTTAVNTILNNVAVASVAAGRLGGVFNGTTAAALTIEGSGNSIAADGGRALSMNNTTVGDAGFNFASITGTLMSNATGINISGLETGTTGLSIDLVDVEDVNREAIELTNINGAGGLTITAADIDLASGSLAKGIEVLGTVGTGGITIGNGTAGGVTGLNIDLVGAQNGTDAILLGNTSGTVNIANAATGTLVIGATQGTDTGIEFAGAFAGTANIGNSTNQSTITTRNRAIETGSIGGTADINITNVDVRSTQNDAIFVSGAAAGSTLDFVDVAINEAGSTVLHNGVKIENSDAEVTFTNVDINAAGGHGIFSRDDNTIGSLTLNGTANTIDGTGQRGVEMSGGVATISNLTVGSTTAVAGEGIQIASSTAATTQVTLNNTIIQGVGTNQSGIVIVGNAASPTLTVSGSGNSINNANGSGLSINDATIGMAGLSFNGITSTNSNDHGIFLDNLTGGALNIGTTTITNSAIESIDINGTNTSAINLGDVNIALGTGNSTALDVNGATLNGNLTATDFDVTSTSIAGTTAIDLTGTNGTGSILLGDTNTNGGAQITIAGVETGVEFSAATNITLRYGDGDGTVGAGSDGTASSISATTVIGGTLAPNGSYDFSDAVLTGDVSNITFSGPSFFVFDEAGTSGAGTFTDPGTAAQAAAANADVLVAVNNSTVFGSVIRLFDANQGAINTLTLDDNQALIGLTNGQTIDVADLITVSSSGGLPASYQFTGLPTGGTTITGTGVADSIGPGLSTNGVNNAVSLTGSAGIAGITITTSGSGDAINGSFSATEKVVTDGVFFGAGGSGFGLNIATTGGATTVELNDTSGNRGISLDGSAGGTLTVTGNNTDGPNGNSTSALELDTVTIGAAGLSFGDIFQNGKTNTAIDLTNVNGGNLSIGSGNILLMETTAVSINGGTSNITIGADISNTATGRSVNVRNKTAGTVTFSGEIDDNGLGLFLNNNAGASIVFTGNVDVDVSGSDIALLLNNSTVAFQGASNTTAFTSTQGNAVGVFGTSTVNFNAGTTDIDATNGGGLALAGSASQTINFGSGTSTINTTSGTGIFAVGPGVSGGTVAITGNAQVTTTTGVAVNIQNTTIGAAGVTVQSASTNGAATGVVISNTGTVGGFTVTGVGTTAGSGGTIANALVRGFSLLNTQDVNLSNITITNPFQEGINATDVTDLDLTNVTITGAGNGGTGGDAISLTNLAGTGAEASVFNGVQILRTDGDDGIQIDQSNGGTADLQIVGNTVIEDTFDDAIAATSANGSTLNLTIGNASAVGVGETVIIDNAFTGVLLDSTASGTINATIQNTILRSGSGDASINRSSAGTSGVLFNGINARANGAGIVQLIATGNDIDFDNIVALGTGSSGITLGGSGTIGGSSISNNTIDSNDEFISGIFINYSGTGALNTNTVIIDNNAINLTGSGSNQTIKGIEIEADGSSGGVSVTVTNNTINSAGANTFSAGIVALTGNLVGPSAATVCLDIRGNNSSAPAATADGDDYTLVVFSNAVTQLEGLTGNPAAADIQNFITANDAGSATTINTDVKTFEVGTGNFVGVVSCP